MRRLRHRHDDVRGQPEWYAHYFDAALSHGFTGVKVRLGTDPDAAVERVRAVRAHVGPDIFVAMVDAYWGYAADDALALAQRLAPWTSLFFEEPSPQYDTAGLRMLGETFADPDRRRRARLFAARSTS